MRSPSIRRSLLFRCGVGVGTLLCLLSATIYLLVRHSLYREMDQSITQTAALLANQVELENDRVTFEWQEGLGSNDALILEGLFQFWDERSDLTTRSPALQSNNLPKFQGANGSPLVKTIVLPNGHGTADFCTGHRRGEVMVAKAWRLLKRRMSSWKSFNVDCRLFLRPRRQS